MSNKNLPHLQGLDIRNAYVTVHIDYEPVIEKIDKAQYWLDDTIMESMLPYMPNETGTFKQNTVRISKSLAGSGLICVAAPPFGRYLYEGKKMVDSVTGKGPAVIPLESGEYILRFRKGSTLVPTEEPLTYSNPLAKPHWFDVAKEQFEEQWVKGVERILNE